MSWMLGCKGWACRIAGSHPDAGAYQDSDLAYRAPFQTAIRIEMLPEQGEMLPEQGNSLVQTDLRKSTWYVYVGVVGAGCQPGAWEGAAPCSPAH